ncbi:MAG: hypothetical protein GY821_17670 [Gammaproteobacteria bacterium]|nr:hypothetical protein [Gammaproteobacteria bacterium]
MLGQEQINLQQFAKLKKQHLHNMIEENTITHWRHSITHVTQLVDLGVQYRAV